MGPSFRLDRSDAWFRVPSHDPNLARDGGLIEQVKETYHADLPILAPVHMMKRQTRLLIDFAESFSRK